MHQWCPVPGATGAWDRFGKRRQFTPASDPGRRSVIGARRACAACRDSRWLGPNPGPAHRDVGLHGYGRGRVRHQPPEPSPRVNEIAAASRAARDEADKEAPLPSGHAELSPDRHRHEPVTNGSSAGLETLSGSNLGFGDDGLAGTGDKANSTDFSGRVRAGSSRGRRPLFKSARRPGAEEELGRNSRARRSTGARAGLAGNEEAS